ncbi:MAG: DUF945 family protein [Desulfobacter sp.]|nr:MAG: DUF945 family protein [Desulfobacter sp.]
MKKLVIVLAVIILAALPGIPFVNGIVMERTLRGAVDNMNKIYAGTGSDMQFEIKEYDRGLFDTHVEWRIDFGSLSKAYGIEDVVLTEKASHGFLGITSETSLEKNLWYTDWVRSQLEGKDPLKIRTQYSAIGPIVSIVTLDPVVVDTKKAPLNIGALEFTSTLDKSFTSVAMSGKWDGLSEDNANKMGPVTLEAVHKRLSDLIWEGKGTIAVDSFSADEADASVNLSDLSLDYDLSADPDHKNMDITMGMKAGNIVFNGKPLSEWAVEFGMNNIDIQAYEEFAQVYYKMINSHMTRTAGAALSPEAAGEEMQKLMARNAPKLVGGLEKLMKKGLEFKVSRLDLALPQGEITGSLALGLKQDVTMAQCMMLAVQPDLALDIFSLNSALSLPAALAGPRQQDLTVPAFPGMKTGIFIREGETLKHRAEIRENKLYLNGQEVELAF